MNSQLTIIIQIYKRTSKFHHMASLVSWYGGLAKKQATQV